MKVICIIILVLISINYVARGNTIKDEGAAGTARPPWVTNAPAVHEVPLPAVHEVSLPGVGSSSTPRVMCCEEEWAPFGDKCYYFSKGTLTWQSARNWCRDFGGGDLARVDTSQLNYFIAGSGKTTTWIGLNDVSIISFIISALNDPLGMSLLDAFYAGLSNTSFLYYYMSYS